MFKRHLLYTGKSCKPFIIEIDKPLTDSFCFSGTVVAAHKKCPHGVGHRSDNWSNPVKDLIRGDIAEYIIIHHDEKARLEAKWSL